MTTVIKLATEMENVLSSNFYNVDVTTELETQLEKLADLYLENFFKEDDV